MPTVICIACGRVNGKEGQKEIKKQEGISDNCGYALFLISAWVSFVFCMRKKKFDILRMERKNAMI